jgi:anti-anti-sigma factor
MLLGALCQVDDGGVRSAISQGEGSPVRGEESNVASSSEETLSLSVRAEGSARILKVSGEVDYYCERQLNEALSSALAAKPRVLVVDLTEAHYFDSTGLAELARAARECEGYGGAIRVVVRPKSPIERIMSVVGFDQRFGAYRSVEAALADVEIGTRAASPDHRASEVR